MLVSVAVAIGATFGPVRSVARGPLERGERIGRTRAWLEPSGFYPAELDGDRSFSWMHDAGRIRLQHLPRPVAYRLSLWVQPAVVAQPVQLIAAVDGIAQPPITLHPGPQQIDLDIPPADSGRAIVDLTVSRTLIPGPADKRSLGLRVDDVALEAVQSRLRIPSEALGGMLALAIAIGLSVALTWGVRPLAFALGAGAGAWIGFLVSFDAAFLGDYPIRLPPLGMAIALAAIVTAAGTRQREHGAWTWRPLLGLLIVLTACQVALFLHPMVAVGDSIFHVHAKDTQIYAANLPKTGVLDTKKYTDERNRAWIFRSVGYGHAFGWWKEFISTLRMYGYDYVPSIEHEDTLMSPDEGLTKAAKFLNEIVIREQPAAPWWV